MSKIVKADTALELAIEKQVRMGAALLQNALAIVEPALKAVSFPIETGRTNNGKTSFYREKGILVENNFYSEVTRPYRFLKGSQLWLTESGHFLQLTRYGECCHLLQAADYPFVMITP